MHHALCINDILQILFQFTDTSTDIAAVSVCKAWHESALDALWYHVDRLDRLFSILAPLTNVTPEILTFSQFYIPPDRWKRFFFYANRVRHLELTGNPPYIHHESFSTLAISRPVLRVLRNLICLTVTVMNPTARFLPHISLFLHAGLKRLRVSSSSVDEVPLDDTYAWSCFFRDTLMRSPNIQYLELGPRWSPRAIAYPLSMFVKSLKELRHLSMCDMMFVSDVVTALSHCPKLEVLAAIASPVENSSDPDNIDDLESFFPVIEAGGFPAIESMALKANLWDCVVFLQSTFPAHRLNELTVNSLRVEISSNVQCLCESISQCCPSLEKLSLGIDHVNHGVPTDFVGFAALEPLLVLKGITSFDFHHSFPCSITDAQATRMAKTWPRLIRLSLNPLPFPVSNEHHSLTFVALNSFADHCPDLEILHLYMHACTLPSTSKAVFPKLRVLQLGISDLDWEPQDVALFLTDITTSDCEIVHASHVENVRVIAMAWDDGSNMIGRVEVLEGMFGEVLGMVPMLRRVHRRYKDRLKDLEERVERLNAKAEETAEL